MKKINFNLKSIIREVVVFTIVFFAIVWFLSIGDTIDHNYTMWCNVYEVNGDEVLFIDDTGNIWAIENDRGIEYTEGERVKIYFFDNYTTDRKDDEITKVKKIAKTKSPQLADGENENV